jgi:hypothetical protein
MSTFKSIPRAGWFVAGVTAAVLMIPTAVGATVGVQAALKMTGIEGTSGNQADVTGAGQLLTTEAPPSAYAQSSDVLMLTSGGLVALAGASGNHSLLISTIHINVDSLSGAGPAVALAIFPGTSCPATATGSTWNHLFSAPAVGETDIPYSPGLIVAKGSILCGETLGTIDATVSVSGYIVPAADAPTSS